MPSLHQSGLVGSENINLTVVFHARNASNSWSHSRSPSPISKRARARKRPRPKSPVPRSKSEARKEREQASTQAAAGQSATRAHRLSSLRSVPRAAVSKGCFRAPYYLWCRPAFSSGDHSVNTCWSRFSGESGGGGGEMMGGILKIASRSDRRSTDKQRIRTRSMRLPKKGGKFRFPRRKRLRMQGCDGSIDQSNARLHFASR
jgi:hypothetical protein